MPKRPTWNHEIRYDLSVDVSQRMTLGGCDGSGINHFSSSMIAVMLETRRRDEITGKARAVATRARIAVESTWDVLVPEKDGHLFLLPVKEVITVAKRHVGNAGEIIRGQLLVPYEVPELPPIA